MAGLVSPATLEQIRAASDIVDVISAAVPLKRAGASFVALCPFHREKSPSFHVNPRKQTFHCFGCGKGGDVFTFIKDYESLDFMEAVKRLAERARIPLQFDSDPKYQEKQFLKDKLFDIHEQITQRWHGALLNEAGGQKAREYLEQRGVTHEAIKQFRLGYSPHEWDDSVNWAKAKGIDLGLMEQSGIVVRKEETNNYYGRFRDRLMFPICDEQGRVIGFSGRVLPGDDDPRKYVNSPETPLFTKSRVMFGLDKSKRALLEKQFAIICEGQLDLISCYMAGVQNVVAPQGTALTQEHTRILKRYVSEVVLCFDSDEAGQKAAVRVLDDVLGSGLAVRVATVPPPDDPDTFIKKHGGGAFAELIEKAEGFFDYYLGRLCRINDIRSDKGQKAVLIAMAEAVQKTNDPTLFDKYAQRTAARLGVNALNALQVFKNSKSRPSSPRRDDFEGEEAPDLSWRPNAQEFWLLKILLQDDETLNWTRAHLDEGWIQNSHVREIVSRRLACSENGECTQPAAILSELESPQARSLITEALAEERNIPKPEQQLIEITTRLRNQFIDKKLAGLMQQISVPGIPDSESIRLLTEQKQLQQLKRSPLSSV
jgi:DNA primase